MYFFTFKGKQSIDFKGNLILTHNNQLISARAKSAAPDSTQNIKYILVKKLNFFQKISAMFTVFGFIWGKPNPLTAEDTNLNKPVVNKPKLKVVDKILCHRHGGKGHPAYCTECTKNAI